MLFRSSIGSAAIGRLAPLADYLDMDGPLLLADDTATGIMYENGKVLMSDLPGLGITLKGDYDEVVK